MTKASPRPPNGFTFIELLVVTTILLILASAVLPLAKVTVQRQGEMELHRELREMRAAIDKFKDAVDNGLIGSVDVKAGSEGYPPDLDTLVEGVSVANDASGRKLKFLRRVPVDPLTSSTDWGLRAYADKPDSAIAAFTKYVESTSIQQRFGNDGFFLAGAYKRLGELLEAKGDRVNAVKYYMKFVEMWKDADPDLQPKVAEVRRKLARLSDTEAKR